MDLPEHMFNIEIELHSTSNEIETNSLLENFFKAFIDQQRNEISQLEASCEKLRKSKEDLLATKHQRIRDIFILTHATNKDSDSLHKLSQQMLLQKNTNRIDSEHFAEVLKSIHGEYSNWREKLEKQVRFPRVEDDLLELTEPEIEDKIQTMKKEEESAKYELSAIGEAIENVQFEKQIQEMQNKVDMLKTLKSEMSAHQERLIYELSEFKIKSLEEIKKLSKENDAIKRKIELYE